MKKDRTDRMVELFQQVLTAAGVGSLTHQILHDLGRPPGLKVEMTLPQIRNVVGPMSSMLKDQLQEALDLWLEAATTSA